MPVTQSRRSGDQDAPHRGMTGGSCTACEQMHVSAETACETVHKALPRKRRRTCPGPCCPVAALNSTTGSAVTWPRCFALMPCVFAARGLQCRLPARRCPASAPGWPPGTALARRAARTYRASASRSAWHDRRSSRSPAQCSPARSGAVPSPSALLLMRCRKGQRVVRMVSDSDPRTLAEYVMHCPKIFVR